MPAATWCEACPAVPAATSLGLLGEIVVALARQCPDPWGHARTRRRRGRRPEGGSEPVRVTPVQ
jgi:hypothetical protein